MASSRTNFGFGMYIMKQLQSKKNIIIMSVCCVLGLLAAVLLCKFGHLGKVVEHRCATTNENYKTGDLTGPAGAQQVFIPQEEYLSSMAVRIDTQGGAAAEGELQLTLADAAGSVVAAASLPLAEVLDNNWTYMDLGVKLRVGQPYVYSIEVSGAPVPPRAYYRPVALDRIAENQECYYAGEYIPGGCLAQIYVYELPLDFWQVGAIVSFCLFVAMLCGSGIVWLLGKRG